MCSNVSTLYREDKFPPYELGSSLNGYELGMDRQLNQTQCDAHYPRLFIEADRSRDYWKSRGGVKLSDLEKEPDRDEARAMIVKNRLYILRLGGFQTGTRTRAILASIQEALTTSPFPLPDVEFLIKATDAGSNEGALWGLSRTVDQPEITLIPDFGFYSWDAAGAFVEVADKCKAYEEAQTWTQKIPKLFFRGVLMVPVRQKLFEMGEKFPSWAEISTIDWAKPDNHKSPAEHCEYKFLAHAEGYAYSGRLKYLLQCRSVVVAHSMQYLQHFHTLFDSDMNSPQQNIVILPDKKAGHEWDKLESTMNRLLADDQLVQKISNNSYAHFRHYLNPSSTNCYWRRLIWNWAQVQKFTPKVPENAVPYESFVLVGLDHQKPA